MRAAAGMSTSYLARGAPLLSVCALHPWSAYLSEGNRLRHSIWERFRLRHRRWQRFRLSEGLARTSGSERALGFEKPRGQAAKAARRVKMVVDLMWKGALNDFVEVVFLNMID